MFPATTFFADAAGTDTPFYDWKQTDPQWANIYIGNDTIGNIGCYATSTAILVVYSGLRTEKDFDPGTFVGMMKAVGGFSGNLIYKGKIKNAVPGFQYRSEVLLGKTKEEKTEAISYYLDKGYYIIAGVKNLGHYVAIREVKDGVVYMMDPAGDREALFDHYAVSGVTKIFLHTSTGKKVEINPDDMSKEESSETSEYRIGIYKTTDNLNLRANSSTSSDALTIIPKGTEITVTEIDGIWGKTSYGEYEGYVCLTYASFISDIIFKDPAELSSEEPSSEESSEDPSSEPDVSPEFVTGIYETTGSVNLRKSATTSSSILGAIPKGTTVTVTEVIGTWGKVTYNGKEGYFGLKYAKLISADADNVEFVETETMGEDEWIQLPSTDKYTKGNYITTSKLNLRAEPTTSSSKLLQMPLGSKIQILEVKNGWGRLIYDGKEGWCSLEYCKFESAYIESTSLSDQSVIALLSEKADISSVSLNLYYSDGSVYSVKKGISVSYTIPKMAGIVKAVAKYNGKEYSFNILYVDSKKIEAKENNIYVLISHEKTSSDVFGIESVEMKTSSSANIEGISFTVIILGDVDGNGDVTSTDYLRVKQTFLGLQTISESETLAADINCDGVITATDYLLIKGVFTK